MSQQQRQQQQQQQHYGLQQIDFIDYFNLVEQYMRTRERQQSSPTTNIIIDDKDEEEDEDEVFEDESEEDTRMERATLQMLQQRLIMFTKGIKQRLVQSRGIKSSDYLYELFYEDVFGRLKAISFLARQFQCAVAEQLVAQCYQFIQEEYCCHCSPSNGNGGESVSRGENSFLQYKNYNETIHGQIIELDTACAYSFEYLRFKCCRDLLLSFSQQAIQKVMKRLKIEKERVKQNMKMCAIDSKQEQDLISRQEFNTLRHANERYNWYQMLLSDIDYYMCAASDLSLSIQFSKQIPAS